MSNQPTIAPSTQPAPAEANLVVRRSKRQPTPAKPFTAPPIAGKHKHKRKPRTGTAKTKARGTREGGSKDTTARPVERRDVPTQLPTPPGPSPEPSIEEARSSLEPPAEEITPPVPARRTTDELIKDMVFWVADQVWEVKGILRGLDENRGRQTKEVRSLPLPTRCAVGVQTELMIPRKDEVAGYPPRLKRKLTSDALEALEPEDVHGATKKARVE